MFLLLACAPPVPPRIGITGATEAIEQAISAAGGVPVPLTPEVTRLDGLDGLVLGPGQDLDPALYDELPDPTVRLVPPERQDQDLILARTALAQDVPVLGICLGAQSLAVAANGSLVQDIPSEVGVGVDHRQAHPIAIVADSPLFDWYGASATVASNHHQAVDKLPTWMEVAAKSPDGTIEAFWTPKRTFAVGVQFHPEQMPGTQVWEALVRAARSTERLEGEKPSAPPGALPVCSTVEAPFLGERRSWATLRKRVGSNFGDPRTSYVSGHKHGGVDLGTAFAEEVYAICEGRVADIHLAFPHQTVVVEHHLPDGRIVYSSYKHVTDVDVHIGDRVTAVTRIGRVFDEEEQARVPWRQNHLHFEMRSSIADGGTASWTSMSKEELERFAFDPVPFFEERME